LLFPPGLGSGSFGKRRSLLDSTSSSSSSRRAAFAPGHRRCSRPVVVVIATPYFGRNATDDGTTTFGETRRFVAVLPLGNVDAKQQPSWIRVVVVVVVVVANGARDGPMRRDVLPPPTTADSPPVRDARVSPAVAYRPADDDDDDGPALGRRVVVVVVGAAGGRLSSIMDDDDDAVPVRSPGIELGGCAGDEDGPPGAYPACVCPPERSDDAGDDGLELGRRVGASDDDVSTEEDDASSSSLLPVVVDSPAIRAVDFFPPPPMTMMLGRLVGAIAEGADDASIVDSTVLVRIDTRFPEASNPPEEEKEEGTVVGKVVG